MRILKKKKREKEGRKREREKKEKKEGRQKRVMSGYFKLKACIGSKLKYTQHILELHWQKK
jgi:hypothetical protein